MGLLGRWLTNRKRKPFSLTHGELNVLRRRGYLAERNGGGSPYRVNDVRFGGIRGQDSPILGLSCLVTPAKGVWRGELLTEVRGSVRFGTGLTGCSCGYRL